MKPQCKDCYFAAPSTFPNKDGKKWYSCRYTPPMPYADEKQSMYKDWRIVPEDFWCGKYTQLDSGRRQFNDHFYSQSI